MQLTCLPCVFCTVDDLAAVEVVLLLVRKVKVKWEKCLALLLLVSEQVRIQIPGSDSSPTARAMGILFALLSDVITSLSFSVLLWSDF